MRIGSTAALTIAFAAVCGGPALAAPYGPPTPAVSKTTPAQQAMAIYRDEYAHWRFKPCASARPGEIVVCGNGRGGSADRLPLPEERGPPDVRVATGEILSGSAALNAENQSCTDANCAASGAINLIAVAASGVQVVRAIVDPEAASDHADRQHPWRH